MRSTESATYFERLDYKYEISDGDKIKVTRKKLNTISSMIEYCAIVNIEENIERMRADLWITASIAEISRADAVDSVAKKAKERGNFWV